MAYEKGEKMGKSHSEGMGKRMGAKHSGGALGKKMAGSSASIGKGSHKMKGLATPAK